MAESLKNMKEAVMGQGGGLQSTSSIVGDTIAENTKSGESKKVDEATSSLGKFSKGAPTTEGTNVSANEQVTNMQTGSADHLNLGPDLKK